MEHWGCCAGTEKYYRSCVGTVDYYRSTRENLLVQQSTIGAIGWLYWYIRVLLEHSGGCAGTADYYWSWRCVGKQSTIGTLGRLFGYRRVL